MLLDFQPGRKRGRFPIAGASYTLKLLIIVGVIVNGLGMIDGSKMHGYFFFIIIT